MGTRTNVAAVALLAAALAPIAWGASTAGASPVTCAGASATSAKGFNACGYNYDARVFSGLADGVDRTLDGTVWGDTTYANDHLVMKWNAAWDACNAHGYNDPTYCAGAWVTNEWNGMLTNGSATTEHVKIIWVGSAGTASAYWVSGGYLIWGNYEAVMDQGMVNGQITWWANATPNGLH